MKVLANAQVVIILQSINTSVSNQHIIQFKFIQCYVSIISQNPENVRLK